MQDLICHTSILEMMLALIQHIRPLPFAHYTSVNHHSQSIQFGFALLQDETEVTFLWLFQTWLDAMGRHPPSCIIIDQDLVMKATILKVFPIHIISYIYDIS